MAMPMILSTINGHASDLIYPYWYPIDIDLGVYLLLFIKSIDVHIGIFNLGIVSLIIYFRLWHALPTVWALTYNGPCFDIILAMIISLYFVM